MLKLASDENLNNNIVRGLLRKRPDLDIVRIQDAGLIGVPGVFEADLFAPIGQVIEDILLLAEFSFEGEWEGQIGYIPLK